MLSENTIEILGTFLSGSGVFTVAFFAMRTKYNAILIEIKKFATTEEYQVVEKKVDDFVEDQEKKMEAFIGSHAAEHKELNNHLTSLRENLHEVRNGQTVATVEIKNLTLILNDKFATLQRIVESALSKK